MNQTALTVANTTKVGGMRPVTGGAPFAKGAAPEGARFSLNDEAGRPVVLQARTLATWLDGSARWVLLDFQSDPKPGSVERYTLSWGDPPRPVSHEVPVETGTPEQPLARSGNVEVVPRADALVRISGRIDVAFIATDSEGRQYSARADSIRVETKGDTRSTLELAGSFRDSSGARWFGFRTWISVYAGLSRVLIEPLVVMDAEKDLIQRIRELRLEFTPAKGVRSAQIGGSPGWKGSPQRAARLFQIDDEQYALEGASGKGSKAPGWAEFDDGDGAVAVALRDFWEQWPKSLEVDSKSLRIGLLPGFQVGAFDHMQPSYKHDYFFEGNCCRLRTGQARRWQVWLDLDGNGEALAEHANAPLVAAIDPAWGVATGAWGEIQPAGAPAMAEYDTWAANLFDSYCRCIAESRDYGAMNWGDWFGERTVNWGNHEYDTPRQMYIQFARTGDPKYFHWAFVTARHMSEVDVIHAFNEELKEWFRSSVGERKDYPFRPGMVHEHSVGHVGGFHPVEKIREWYLHFRIGDTDKPYLCLDPYNLGHIFAQGMVYHYFLTGDPWVKQTLETIGDNLARLVEDRKLPFTGEAHMGRVNGWTMLALAACYELGFGKRYLDAMKTLADDALSEQDPNCGGWLYPLPHGHCNCKTRKHIGEAGFIGSIRLNGLYRYHRLTGDERIPQAIKRGIDHMNADLWKDERGGWRYTSCPRTSVAGQPGVTMMALANAVRMHNDPEHARILRKSWTTLFEKLKTQLKASPGVGKAFSSTMYGCPEAAGVVGTLEGKE